MAVVAAVAVTAAARCSRSRADCSTAKTSPSNRDSCCCCSCCAPCWCGDGACACGCCACGCCACCCACCAASRRARAAKRGCGCRARRLRSCAADASAAERCGPGPAHGTVHGTVHAAESSLHHQILQPCQCDHFRQTQPGDPCPHGACRLPAKYLSSKICMPPPTLTYTPAARIFHCAASVSSAASRSAAASTTGSPPAVAAAGAAPPVLLLLLPPTGCRGAHTSRQQVTSSRHAWSVQAACRAVSRQEGRSQFKPSKAHAVMPPTHQVPAAQAWASPAFSSVQAPGLNLAARTLAPATAATAAPPGVPPGAPAATASAR